MIDSASMMNQPAPGRDCGSCAMCCKVYDVPEAESTAGRWCRHYASGRGCDIYATRPHQCRAFFCMWMTQGFLGPEWRPDRARFVLTTDPSTRCLMAQVDPGAAQAWRKEPYYSQLRRWAGATGRPVIVFVNKLATALTADDEFALGTIGADERIVLRPLPGGRQRVEKVKVEA